MFKIKHKINDGQNNFTETLLSNDFNYCKIAETAMLKIGKETVNKLTLRTKKFLQKKEKIELLWDKKTMSCAIVITKNKRPIRVLEVFEVCEVK